MWATWAKMSASFGLPAKGAIRHCYSKVVCRKRVHISFPTSRHLHNRTAANKTAQTYPQNSTHVPTEQYTPTSVLLIASQPSRNILQSALHRCQLSRQSRQSLQCARVSGVVGKHAYNASQHAYLILGTEVGIQPVHGISISHICWTCPRTTAATPASTAQAPTITV